MGLDMAKAKKPITTISYIDPDGNEHKFENMSLDKYTITRWYPDANKEIEDFISPVQLTAKWTQTDPEYSYPQSIWIKFSRWVDRKLKIHPFTRI